MDTVTESSMATAMSLNGGFGVVHRYNTIQQQVNEILKLQDGIVKAAAVGISGDFAERADALAEAGVDILCLDVAHGHHIMMKEALHLLRRDYPHVHLMAGNVATLQGFEDLASWGADSVRCNIGGGCFVAGTLVRTVEGDKPIEQVSIGDSVYTHTGNVRKVVDTLSFDRDEEIAIVNGIEATLNHEFYVVDKDKAHLVNDNNINEIAYWIEAEHLDKSKHLLVEID
jgi:hypothetical protein